MLFYEIMQDVITEEDHEIWNEADFMVNEIMEYSFPAYEYMSDEQLTRWVHDKYLEIKNRK